MELKAKFGRYKAADVQMYLAEQRKSDSEKSQGYIQRIALLEEEVQRLNKVIDEYKAKENVIAKVMLDATQHAKEIEDDCHKRADQSDEACRRLHSEWVTGMQSASANLIKMREEAKRLLDSIDGEFENLCSWAGNRLESLEQTSLPLSTTETDTIEAEIANGAGASLDELCREMGFSETEGNDNSSDAENNGDNCLTGNEGIPYGFENNASENQKNEVNAESVKNENTDGSSDNEN